MTITIRVRGDKDILQMGCLDPEERDISSMYRSSDDLVMIFFYLEGYSRWSRDMNHQSTRRYSYHILILDVEQDC